MSAPHAALLMVGSADPYAAYVPYLCHFDSSTAGPPYRTFVQNGLSGSAIYLQGTSTSIPDVSSAQYKFGGYSLLYAASGNGYVYSNNVDYQMGTGDATVEFWVRPASITTQYLMWDNRVSGSGGFNLATSTTSGKIEMRYGGAAVISSAGGVISSGNWHFIAWSRVSGTSRLFVDGAQVGSDYADSNNYNQSAIVVGAAYNGGLPCVNYYFDEVRVTVGAGRYTGSFSVPTAAFPNP